MKNKLLTKLKFSYVITARPAFKLQISSSSVTNAYLIIDAYVIMLHALQDLVASIVLTIIFGNCSL